MELSCPHCAADVPAWRKSGEIVWCGACQTVFERSTKRPRNTDPVWLRPSWITVEEAFARPATGYREPARQRERATLTITRRWRVPGSWMTLAFSIYWNAFIILFCGLWSLVGPHASVGLIVASALALTAVGLFLTYLSAALLVNHTSIVIDDATLSLRHRPLPWRGRRDLPLDHITQIRVDARRSKDGSSPTFVLAADTREGAVDLIRWTKPTNEADYLAHVIENHLSRWRDQSQRRAS